MLKLNNAEINTEVQESRPCWKIAQGALVKFGYEENLCQDMKHFFPIFHRYKIWNNYNVLRNDLKFKWLDTDLLYHLNLFKFLLISIFLFHLCITIYIYNAHYSTYRPGLKKKKEPLKHQRELGGRPWFLFILKEDQTPGPTQSNLSFPVLALTIDSADVRAEVIKVIRHCHLQWFI